MKISILLACAIVATAFGCSGLKNISVSGIKGSGNIKTENRSVSGFTRIKAGNAFKIEVTGQKDFSVAVETDDNLLSHIRTEVDGDTLVIGSKENVSPSSAVTVRVSMPELAGLDLSGASTAAVTGVRADDLAAEASGASSIKVNGEAQSFEAVASGASKIDAENLKVEDANATASGASTIIVTPTGEADLNASGASTIMYSGEPENLKQNSSGASTIKKK